MDPIRVILADDHKLIREGLRGLLEDNNEVKVIGYAENGNEAVKLADELSPDVVIMDITMPELNGIDATRLITSKHPEIKVVMLSMHYHQRMVTESLHAGAIGYVLKDSAFEDLLFAIKSAKSNNSYFSPGIASIILDGFLGDNSLKKKSYVRLSARENEVLKLIAEGKPTKEIADILSISIKTVEKHRQHIMEKLNISSIAELTKYAIQEGYISLEN